MGKDYIAPPDLSAEAGFTVMNPQESVNNFLSNSISAANNSRSNFQSGINQAIAAANSSRIAEQNRQNALVLQQQRAASQADRLKIADQIKRKSEYEDVGNTVKLYDDLIKSGMPAAQAMQAVEARATLGKSIVGEDSPVYDFYSRLTGGGQVAQPQPTGTELTPEDLAITTQEPINNVDSGQPAQLGAAANVYMPEPQAPMQAPSPLFEAFTRAENAKKAEQQAKMYDTREKAVADQGRAGIVDVIDKVIPEFADKYGRTDEERAYLKSISNDIDTTPEGQKLWSKGKDAFNASESNIDSATQNTKRLLDVYKKMKVRGLTISDSGSSMLKTILGKGVGSASSSGVNYDEKIKAEALIPEDVELSRELYAALSSLEPSFISINRQLGNVGTQTENDFSRAFKLIFAPGITNPDALIRNAEDGFGFLNAGVVKNGIKYGNERAASNAMIELNNRNLVLNAAGRAIPGDPFRNQPVSTQAPTVQQPSIMQQPPAQSVAPKPRPANVARQVPTDVQSIVNRFRSGGY
jgi:hypothetical protein